MHTISSESLKLFIETRSYFEQQKHQAEIALMSKELERVTKGKPIVLVLQPDDMEKLRAFAQPRYL